jgi:hypothetical protein
MSIDAMLHTFQHQYIFELIDDVVIMQHKNNKKVTQATSRTSPLVASRSTGTFLTTTIIPSISRYPWRIDFNDERSRSISMLRQW